MLIDPKDLKTEVFPPPVPVRGCGALLPSAGVMVTHIPTGMFEMHMEADTQLKNRHLAIVALERRMQESVRAGLNLLPRKPGAVAPFAPIHFVPSHGGWFAECPYTGRGIFYRELEDAVASWLVHVVEYDNGKWIAIPSTELENWRGIYASDH